MTEPLERAAASLQETTDFDMYQIEAMDMARAAILSFLEPDEAMVERLAKVVSDTPIRTRTFDMWGHMRGDAVAISDIVSAILAELRAIAGEKP